VAFFVSIMLLISNPASTSTYSGLTVAEISPLPPPSGIFATWYWVDVTTREGDRLRLHVRMMGQDTRRIPAVGDICDAETIEMEIREWVGAGGALPPGYSGLAPTSLMCGGVEMVVESP